MTSTSSQRSEPMFDATIRGLFRTKDRDSMIKAFDLWSYDDVVAHQDAILHAVDTGKMPCDDAWPAADVAQFRAWIAAGSPR